MQFWFFINCRDPFQRPVSEDGGFDDINYCQLLLIGLYSFTILGKIWLICIEKFFFPSFWSQKKKNRLWSSLSLLGRKPLVKKHAGSNTHELTVAVISVKCARHEASQNLSMNGLDDIAGDGRLTLLWGWVTDRIPVLQGMGPH